MDKNFFKSCFDGIFYILLYFIIPVAQCVAYLILDSNLFWYSIVLLISALLYDCYTRHNKSNHTKKNQRITTIGIIVGILLLFSIFVFILQYNGVVIGEYMITPYLLLIVPFFMAVCDLFDLIFKTSLYEGVL